MCLMHGGIEKVRQGYRHMASLWYCFHFATTSEQDFEVSCCGEINDLIKQRLPDIRDLISSWNKLLIFRMLLVKVVCNVILTK